MEDLDNKSKDLSKVDTGRETTHKVEMSKETL